jgi:hypothetical protein
VLDMVLDCYKPRCRYLQTVVATPGGNGVLVEGRGEFGIPESCYIADTGHFNAVEFNICYNQIAYTTLAHCVAHRWLDAMSGWSLQEFLRRQLSDCLIVEFSSSFRRPLNARRFFGAAQMNKLTVKKGTIFMKTSCQFSDEHGMAAEGRMLMAILGDRGAGRV